MVNIRLLVWKIDENKADNACMSHFFMFKTAIHVISPYFSGISLFLSKSPYLEFQNFSIFINLYISLFQILDLPISNQEFPSLFNHSPYFEK